MKLPPNIFTNTEGEEEKERAGKEHIYVCVCVIDYPKAYILYHQKNNGLKSPENRVPNTLR